MPPWAQLVTGPRGAAGWPRGGSEREAGRQLAGPLWHEPKATVPCSRAGQQAHKAVRQTPSWEPHHKERVGTHRTTTLPTFFLFF